MLMARSTPIALHENLTPTQISILKCKARFLLITGPAGTAKTYTGLARGLRLLHANEVERILIIRSAVPTRDIGFLPGSQEEKIDAYVTPYVQAIDKLSPKMKYREMYSKRLIEFESTSFLRGLTFDNAYIMLDEYQNMSAHELETAVTRVGEDSHLVLTGDSDQSDLKGSEAEEHREVIMTLTSMDEFAVYQFGVDDIVRSEFVRSYYKAKEATKTPPVAQWGSQPRLPF